MTENRHISIIVAVARRGAIGRRGELLFPISADLRRFKELTMGHPIIMGRKTFESFPKGPLPGRRNIVVTRNSDYHREDIETAGSLEEAIEKTKGCDEVFIIGGGEIYRNAFKIADRLYLTEIDADAEDADTFFPEVDLGQWSVTEHSDLQTDPRSGVTYWFTNLTRIK